MDKKQAQDIIRVTFETPYDKGRFTNFIKNLLTRIKEAPFTYQGQFIPDAYKPYISVLERIGKYSDGEHKIDILVIKLKKETSLERARTMQRNFVAWYLNGSRGGELKDAALVAFIAPDDVDWRFSLVKMDYKFEQTPSGKMKVKEEFTPARRWSFLVGVNERSHTAQSRLVNILADDEMAPTLAELEEAFNIETVTKEFFLKYRDLFIRTKEALDKVRERDTRVKTDFEAKGVNTVDFAKKLLGQIVFLYFLQKKGWFGVGRDAAWGTGAKQFLRELFEKKHGSFNNFFNDILEPLFYEALRIDRSHDDDYYSRFNCKIPFLNGGLFDPIGNYDWVHTDIHLPDGLFSNKNKTREGDTGDGILDNFDRYNFTVKEDEPLEKEVAIDPELLGKAYEKFNAIRPDNFEEYKKALKSGKKGDESKFNKQFGVYYTPREIVHYMCRQSLINYLATELTDGHSRPVSEHGVNSSGNPVVSKEDIETLIHLGEQVSENEARVESKGKETTTYSYKLPENIRNNAVLIDQKLADITVCDPAVGSGAFPVGMMSEIVKARNILSVFIKDKNNPPKLPLLSKGGEGGFERAERTPYDFKRRCIEHSLYGVDIDPGAVEIAKLRLWLSLVVDEDDIKNIKPLPNLDYKIVCGNSLLGVEKSLFNNRLFNDLETLKPLYFNETNPTRKQEYKKQIDDLIGQITSGHTEFNFEVYFSEIFHSNGGGGFDVVIANPPYVRQEAIKEFKPQLKQTFGPFYCGTADLYTYFYKRGLEILKPSGRLCFIAPNKFMRAGYGKNTRILLASEATPKVVIDFGDLPIFDATTYPSILLVGKSLLPSPLTGEGKGGGEFLAATFTESDQLTCLEETLATVGFTMPIAALKAEGWALERPQVLGLMEKLRKAGKPLGEYVQGRFYRGVLTGLNEAFVIDEATRNRLIAEDPKSADLIKHWLRGRDVRKWKAEWAGLYVIFTRRGTDIEKYPAIKRHLEQFRADLEPKKTGNEEHGRKPGPYKWFEIQDNIAYFEEFEKTKIVYPEVSADSRLAIDDRSRFTDKTTFIIPVEPKQICFILALANSKLMSFFHKNLGSMMRGQYFMNSKIYIEQLPIFAASEVQKTPIIERVRKILANPDSPDVPRLEGEIDRLVYELYGLSIGEIKIVENN